MPSAADLADVHMLREGLVGEEVPLPSLDLAQDDRGRAVAHQARALGLVPVHAEESLLGAHDENVAILPRSEERVGQVERHDEPETRAVDVNAGDARRSGARELHKIGSVARYG